MYRTQSRGRSTSTPKPRGRTPTPKRGPRKDSDSKPAWDDTNGDLNKYKATPEQIARRKAQRVSKHFVPDSRRSSFIGEWPQVQDLDQALDTGEDHHRELDTDAKAHGDISATRHTGTAHANAAGASAAGATGTAATAGATATGSAPFLTLSLTPAAQQQGTPEPAPSPTIDYGAVLALLNKQRSPTPGSTSTPLPATSELIGTMHMSSPFPQFPTAPGGGPSHASARETTSPGHPDSHSHSNTLTTPAAATSTNTSPPFDPHSTPHGSAGGGQSPGLSPGSGPFPFRGYGRLDITLGPQPGGGGMGGDWSSNVHIGAAPSKPSYAPWQLTSSSAAAASAAAAAAHDAAHDVASSGDAAAQHVSVIDATVAPPTWHTYTQHPGPQVHSPPTPSTAAPSALAPAAADHTQPANTNTNTASNPNTASHSRAAAAANTSAAVSVGAANAWAPLSAVHGLSTAVKGIEGRSSQLDVRLRQLEAAVSSQQQQTRADQQQAQQQLSSEAAAQLSALRGELASVVGEQARLRAELSEFTSHTTSLLSKLQTQMHQLFRMTDQQAALGLGGLGSGVGGGRPSSAWAMPSLGLGQQGLFSPASNGAGGAGGGAHHMPLHAQPLQNSHDQQYSHGQQYVGTVSSTTRPGGSSDLAAAAQRLQPSRSLFSDLPATAGAATATPGARATAATAAAAGSSTSGAAGGLRVPPASIPATTYEDSLALPSYAAMRRSTASVTSTTLTPAPSASATAAGYAPAAFTASTSAARSHAAAGAAGAGSGARTFPASFEPRAIGTSPLLGQGLAAAVAAAGGDLASLGIQLPTSKLGGAQVGSLAHYQQHHHDLPQPSSGAWRGVGLHASSPRTSGPGTSSQYNQSGTGSGTGGSGTMGGTGGGGFGGTTTAFGVLPEPLQYSGHASDFKIVRAGGGGGVGESGLSLAAQTAAAMRARAAKGA